MKVIKNEFGTYYFYPCESNNKKGSIIFIHGFATQSNYHDDYFVNEATKEYDYYSLQLPGHGIEEYKQNKKIKVDFYTKYCVDLIKSMNIDKFFLIGHSMGGGLGVRVANKLKNNVIAYVAVTPMNSKLPPICITNYWKFTPKNFKKTLKLQSILYNDLHKTKKDENINLFLEKESNYQIQHRTFFKQLKFDMFSLKNVLNCKKNEKEISVPVLAIAGKYDKMIPYKSVYKMFKLNSQKHKKNNVEFELFDFSGHLPFQEENERYIKSVLSFLNRKNYIKGENNS